MSFHDGLIAFLTIVVSLILVIVIVGAAWGLMWKVKFIFVTYTIPLSSTPSKNNYFLTLP